MRFASKVDRSVVKEFIQKDKTITCPKTGEYYALIDSETFEILSALCIVDDGEKYHVQGMRTAPKNRHKGYSTKLLKYVMKEYTDKPLYADCLIKSKNIFLKLGFALIAIVIVRGHEEWQVIKQP